MGTEQKVVVITGASQGFGAGLVKAYRDRNYRVIGNSRSIKPSKDADVLTIAGDVADPKTAERIVVGRMGEIRDIVDAIMFLENAPFVTGEILHVDGGQSAGH
jgi:NAD(P)-dependent dehydrogenase (short-subunit alcohol dehydrogenase family)